MSSTPTQPESTREHMAVRCMACGFIAGESVDPFGDWRRYGCYGEGREGAEHGPTETAPVVLEHQLEEARQELRKLTSKLESGYSFCHPENDCEGMKAAMREAGRLEEVREELERIASEHEATVAAPEMEVIRDWHDGAAKALRKALALLTTPGDGERRPGAPYAKCHECGHTDDPRRTTCLNCQGQMQVVDPSAPGASEWPEVTMYRYSSGGPVQLFGDEEQPPDTELHRYHPAPEGPEQ